MANKHAAYDLAQMQSLPLEAKILMAKRRIQEWYDIQKDWVWDTSLMNLTNYMAKTS